jgi:hypothetical protein
MLKIIKQNGWHTLTHLHVSSIRATYTIENNNNPVATRYPHTDNIFKRTQCTLYTYILLYVDIICVVHIHPFVRKGTTTYSYKLYGRLTLVTFPENTHVYLLVKHQYNGRNHVRTHVLPLYFYVYHACTNGMNLFVESTDTHYTCTHNINIYTYRYITPCSYVCT